MDNPVHSCNIQLPVVNRCEIKDRRFGQNGSLFVTCPNYFRISYGTSWKKFPGVFIGEKHICKKKGNCDSSI